MLNNDFSLAGAKSDILKLVLCYMIVLLHTVELDYTFPILRCAVPLFFMLSSYFLFSKMCRCQTPNEKKHLLYGYIKRNLQLYSFWTLLFIPFIVQFRGWLNEGGVLLILRDVLFAGTFPASWYIIASVYGTIFIYYASRYLPQYILLFICFLCYSICVFSSNYGALFECCDVYEAYCCCFSNPYNSFLVSFIWILLGKYLAEHKITMSNKKLQIFLGLSFTMLLIERIAIGKLNMAVTDDCYIFLIPFCYYILIWIGRIKYLGKPLLLCRKISTITYCSHMTIAVCCSSLIKLYICERDNLGGWILMITIIFTLLLSITILYFEKNRYLRWLRYSY